MGSDAIKGCRVTLSPSLRESRSLRDGEGCIEAVPELVLAPPPHNIRRWLKSVAESIGPNSRGEGELMRVVLLGFSNADAAAIVGITRTKNGPRFLTGRFEFKCSKRFTRLQLQVQLLPLEQRLA